MQNIMIKVVLGVLAALTLILSSYAFAEQMDYSRWSAHNPDSAVPIDHAPMESILKFISVTNNGRHSYAYDRLKGKPLEFVSAYRGFLEQIPVSALNKDEQLAYWLNLHNIRVIEKIANHLSERGKMKKHRGEPGNPGDWWSERSLVVEGVAVSLEDIEQNILLNHWNDPRIIYGLFYGVKGSGFDGTQGFSGKTVQRQLDTLAKQFVNDQRNVKIKKDSVEVSSLYVWNKARLFGDDQALLAHLRTFADADLSEDLNHVSDIREKHKFSWSTNAYVTQRANIGVDLSNQRGSGGYIGGS